MAVNKKISNSLSVNTDFKVSIGNKEGVIMSLLSKAVSTAGHKNKKEAVMELNQSYLETKENDDLFLSKLLELTYEDIETLFLSLCGSDKNRRFSKQHERKGSLKKSSVRNVGFSNNGYIEEFESRHQSNYLGRKRSQVSITEEVSKVLDCLRKGFYLRKDLTMVELEEESLLSIINVHLKVGNYYACVWLLIQFQARSFFDHILLSLSDSQKYKLYQLSMDSVTNIIQNETPLSDSKFKTASECLRLACKLALNKVEPYHLLCRICRKANRTLEALEIANTYLEKINEKAEIIIIQKVFCLIDNAEINEALLLINNTLSGCEIVDLKMLSILNGVLFLLCEKPSKGMEILRIYKVDEHKTVLINILEQLYNTELYFIVNQCKKFLQHLFSTCSQSKNGDIKNDIYEIRSFLMLACYLLMIKNPKELQISYLYAECLYICEAYELAQAFLVKLVKDFQTESLPMIYLANFRLKLGAYVAATEDFRTMYIMWGTQRLLKDLSTLSLDDRKEIARVHRLHGFRHFNHGGEFKEAVECFSVAICAIGLSATGLLLLRGFCYAHLNNFKTAMEDFNKCLEADNSVSAALCGHAVLYAVTTHVEEAISSFQNAFATDPNACQQCLTKMPLEHVLTFAQLVIQYIKQELDEIKQRIKKKFSRTETNLIRTVVAGNNTLNTEMLKYSEFLCRIFPGNVDYLSTYIECLYVSNNLSAARYETNKALNTFSSSVSIFHAWECVFQAQQKMFDEAISQLKQVRDNNDDMVNVISYLDCKLRRHLFDKVTKTAKVLINEEKYDDASKYYNIADMLCTKNVESIRGRMECHFKTGNMKKWLQDISKIIELQPTAHDIYSRAQYYQAEGEDEKACEDYMTALSLYEEETIQNVAINANGDEIVELFYSCARCMTELEKHEEVLKLCNAGLKFYPHHKNLKQLREKTRPNVNKCLIQ